MLALKFGLLRGASGSLLLISFCLGSVCSGNYGR